MFCGELSNRVCGVFQMDFVVIFSSTFSGELLNVFFGKFLIKVCGEMFCGEIPFNLVHLTLKPTPFTQCIKAALDYRHFS